ncbi:MAG: hypothetical protein FWG30_04945 [Eubacteriaceae bacterium]|nr:hypothetical protein [Eubacteriaceae bacterium]
MATESKSPIDSEGFGNESYHELKPGIKLWLASSDGFFGPGTVQLLTLIEKNGSMLYASQEMGISYSKARYIIDKTEKRLGSSVIRKHQGGKTGSGSELTELGCELIKRYNAFVEECTALLQESFDRHFEGINLKWE